MRRLRWVADGGASEAEPRALHGAERLVVVRGEAELLGVGPRLDVFPRLCEIKILRRVRAEFRAPDTLIVFDTVPRATRAAPGVELRAEQIFCPLDDEDFDSSLKITAARGGRSSLAGPALIPEPQRARYKPRNRATGL